MLFSTKTSFDRISIKIASPEMIRSWSYGEVKKPETINYRTLKPEKDGLFCERIFGPVKDWECNCGKYKGMKYKGVVCDRCGVEITRSVVRRERMGHIQLAAPIVHVWFFKVVPSRLSALLGITYRNLEKIIYYEEFIVTDPGETPLAKGEMLTIEKYYDCVDRYGENAFVAKIGSEAIRDLLADLDIEKKISQIRKSLEKTGPNLRKQLKVLSILEDFRRSDNDPNWLVMDVLPVIPPDLRPLVPLDGGRFATSDLNDLYRRVINRNNRLKKLIGLNAPDIIIRNEKRMLQEAVDALFDNGRHGRPALGANNRSLKSLADMLKGKQGRFRQNLLGKRVDYSGRSVIVVGSNLNLNECGLPKEMALELFEPFIIRKLRDRGIVHTVKGAREMVEKAKLEVWDILEEVIQDHYVLLNRAPTLHRLSIQAFRPKLIEGKAIRIHPLVCAAFNADFDGDQMAVHVPLSLEAQMEARVLMNAARNLFSPANGKAITTPSQDMVLGIAYMTKEVDGAKGEGIVFADLDEVITAYQDKEVDLHAKIKVRIKGPVYGQGDFPRDKSQVVDTTVGRVLFNTILPDGFPFVNMVLNKGRLGQLVKDSYDLMGHNKTVEVLDNIKEIGFLYSTYSGLSIAISDLNIPKEKEAIISKARKEAERIEDQYRKGLITYGERYSKIIDIWTHTTEEVSNKLFEGFDLFNPLYLMASSGARGSKLQIRQLAGMRGLMAKPSGEIIENPIVANFREGLNVLEYFLSAHGARKGLADTALKTADAGYLTRRLVDVSQDVIVIEEDCGTLNGIVVSAIIEGDNEVVSLEERIIGRTALDNIVDVITDKVIVKSGEEITEDKSKRIKEAGIEMVRIRSALTCESQRGVCAKCYGRNLATGKSVEVGEAVGVIAAQSIGEPGTQLTMRTFHIGGTASRIVEKSSIEPKSSGKIVYHNLRVVKKKEGFVVLNRNGAVSINSESGRELERYPVPQGALILFPDKSEVKKKETIIKWDPYTIPILTEVEGSVKYEDIIENVTIKQQVNEISGIKERIVLEHRADYHPQIVIVGKNKEILGIYPIPRGAHILVDEKQRVSAGDIVAKQPKVTIKTRDITGGLPRVAELFEMRKPKDPAVMSEIDGYVEFTENKKGQRKIIVKSPGGMVKEYTLPAGKHPTVYKGDYVTAGQQLTDGSMVLQDILRICGDRVLQEYLVNEIQEVYRLQGVKINDKHIEVIIRQMLRKVQIEDPGDSDHLPGDYVDKHRLIADNKNLIKEGKRPATYSPLLLGITKAALHTESFISAASFQETARVLTEASWAGKIDDLYGLKENVIVGHVIPAGTGAKANIVVAEEDAVLTEENKE